MCESRFIDAIMYIEKILCKKVILCSHFLECLRLLLWRKQGQYFLSHISLICYATWSVVVSFWIMSNAEFVHFPSVDIFIFCVLVLQMDFSTGKSISARETQWMFFFFFTITGKLCWSQQRPSPRRLRHKRFYLFLVFNGACITHLLVLIL